MTCIKCNKEMLFLGVWPALDAAAKLFRRYKCSQCKTFFVEPV